MENYLINPLWIYFIDVCSDIEIILLFCLILGAIVCVVFSLWHLCQIAYDYLDEDDGEFKATKIASKTSIIVTIISLILTCAIPSEKTMYTMLVASYLTEENINSATETVTDVVDYIFEKVDELQGE